MKLSIKLSCSRLATAAAHGAMILAGAFLLTPGPVAGQITYDLARDYSRASNPNSVWSYGWASEIRGPMHRLTFNEVDQPLPSGDRAEYWAVSQAEPPAVYHNPTTNTMLVHDNQGVYLPGAVWFYAGFEGTPYRFGVIRFTVPHGRDGFWRLATAVQPLYYGPISGDTDFHVVKNGTELFGRFVDPSSGSGYTNMLNLAAGDTIDFMVGRGQDDLLYASGLIIAATLTSEPIPPEPRFDLARDFSLAPDPGGAWSYGWAADTDGSFNPISFTKTIGSDNGVPIAVWQLSPTELPSIAQVLGPGTAVSAEAQFIAPPGTVYFTPGLDGAPQNFAVIRCTVPADLGDSYRVEAAVRPVFDGYFSGDTDFHVLRNGAELFSRFLTATAGSSYSNVMTLAAGDTIDFVVGRGQDAQQFGSALKIQARLTLANPVLSVSDLIVAEGDKGRQNADFTVRLSQPAQTPVTVVFATVNGTALAGQDYEAATGTLRFAPGETTKTVRVVVTADKPAEPEEEFYLELRGAVGARISRARATCIITEIRISDVRIDAAVSFNTVAGRFYTVEKSDNMKDWSVVEDAALVPGTGGLVTVFDRGAGCQGHRIYRARLVTE